MFPFFLLAVPGLGRTFPLSLNFSSLSRRETVANEPPRRRTIHLPLGR